MQDEKSLEYQQVAALVCNDLDCLHDIATTQNLTAEQLVKQIALTHKMKDEVIADKENRERRFYAVMMLYNLPRGIVSEEVA